MSLRHTDDDTLEIADPSRRNRKRNRDYHLLLFLSCFFPSAFALLCLFNDSGLRCDVKRGRRGCFWALDEEERGGDWKGRRKNPLPHQSLRREKEKEDWGDGKKRRRGRERERFPSLLRGMGGPLHATSTKKYTVTKVACSGESSLQRFFTPSFPSLFSNFLPLRPLRGLLRSENFNEMNMASRLADDRGLK